MASLGLSSVLSTVSSVLQTHTQSIYVKEAKFSLTHSFSLPLSLFLLVSPLVCFEPDLRMGICMWRHVIFTLVHILCCALIISNILQFPGSHPAAFSSRSSVSLKEQFCQKWTIWHYLLTLVLRQTCMLLCFVHQSQKEILWCCFTGKNLNMIGLTTWGKKSNCEFFDKNCD